MWQRPRSGTQYAVVQRAASLVGDNKVVDLGLV
jgi:hypothetical protein